MSETCECGRAFKTSQALGMHRSWSQRNGGCSGPGSSVKLLDRGTVCFRCGHDFGSVHQLQHHHQRRRAGSGMVCIDSRNLRERALERIRKNLE